MLARTTEQKRQPILHQVDFFCFDHLSTHLNHNYSMEMADIFEASFSASFRALAKVNEFDRKVE